MNEQHIERMTPKNPQSAFIRQCDKCGMTTAIDIDPSPENWRNLYLRGQTIHTLPQVEAMELWKTAGRCHCKA